MLANGAHVSIDGVNLRIAEQIESHYQHEWVTPLVSRTDVTGVPGKQQLFPDRLLWTFDDWSGGEGNNVYQPDQPKKYRTSTALNPRNAGQVTGRPTRTVTSISSQADTIINDFNRFATGAGALWFGMTDDASPDNPWLYYSTDGTTWQTVTDADVGGLNVLDSMYGTSDYIYYASHLTTSGGDIYRNNRSRDTGTITAEEYVYNSSLSDEAIRAMLVEGLSIYWWSWAKLYRVDWDGSTTATTETLLDSAEDVSGDGFEVRSGLIRAEEHLVYFTGVEGNSIVRSFTDGAGGVFWAPPSSFSVTDITYHQGTVWICGYWGTADNTGRGALWGIPLSTRTPTLVHEFRVNTNENCLPISMASVAKDQLFIGCSDGKLFAYDISEDAMSLVDDLEGTYQFSSNDERMICVGVFGEGRHVVVTDPARVSSHEFVRYSTDEPDDRSVTLANQIIEMPDWDYDFPHQLKKLMGFHVTFEPMVTNQTITISYSKDGGTSYTALTAITSATSGNTDGRVFLPVSTPSLDFNFYKLRFKAEVESASGALTPIVYGITAEARLVPTTQRWRLAVLLTDESQGQRIGGDDRDAIEMRDALYTAKETGDVVSFIDGYRHGKKLTQTTYNVLVKDVQDNITQNGQGYMVLELEEVPE